MTLQQLPTLNATLNSLSALLLLAGFVFIRRGYRRAHRACMLAAFASSTLFLISYLVYHAQAGRVIFQGPPLVRKIYLAILLSHTLLAAIIVPLALTTLYLAWREKFDAHKQLARWTWPIWMYVSCTGVIIYVMLYHLWPSR